MYVRYGVRPRYNTRMCLYLLLFGCCNGLLCVSSSFVRSVGNCQYSLKLGGSNCIFILIFVWDVFCGWWPRFYLNVMQYCMCCDVCVRWVVSVYCVLYTRKEVVAKEAIITVFIYGGKVVSLTDPLHFPPQKHYFSAFDTHSCWRLSISQYLVRPEELCKLKKFFRLIGSRTPLTESYCGMLLLFNRNRVFCL
jgi:hypothetical protein